MSKTYINELVSQNAAMLCDNKGQLIGRKGSSNAEEYPALESFVGDRETKQDIVARLGIMVDNYEHEFGEKPPENVVAAAVGAVRGLGDLYSREAKRTGGQIALESVPGNMTTTEHVAQILNIQNTLAMEHELFGILPQVATTFPSSVDETNLFEMKREAAKDWGSVSADDPLGIEFKGGLSELDPPQVFTGNGTQTDFPLAAAHPVAKEQTVVFINYDPVGKEEGGSFSGSKVIDSTTYTISGSYSSFADGSGTLTVTPALPVGAQVRITRPLNLEDSNGEKYIQGLKYDTTKRTVKPLENALDLETTFHAELSFQRNFKVALQAYGEKDLFRTINADRGYNAIKEMYEASKFQPDAVATGEDHNNDPDKAFKSTPPSGSGYTDQEYIKATLPKWLWLQDKALQTNSVYGFLSKIICGDDFVRLLMVLPEELFKFSPVYIPSHDIVFLGTFKGKHKVFYDSKEKIIPSDEILMIATSNDSLFHNGFLSSTAVPLNSFRFQMTRMMTRHARLWCRVYRRLDNPKYFRRAKIS